MNKINSFFRLGLILMIASIFLWTNSCKHEPKLIPGNRDTTSNPQDTSKPLGNPCSPDTMYFDKDILPILASNCAVSGCHDAITKEEGINLSDYQSTINSGIIKVGNPSGSDLIESIQETKPDKKMPPPPRTAISANDLAKLEKWIKQGAKNLKCDSGCDTVSPSYTKNIKTIVGNYCTGCHGNISPSAGLSLTTYAVLKSQVDNGKLKSSITPLSGGKLMPPYGSVPLTDCAKKILLLWIENGAPE